MIAESISISVDGSGGTVEGPGGWGAVLRYRDGDAMVFSGSSDNSTNNMMEYQAVLEGLTRAWKMFRRGDLPQRTPVYLYSDSQLVIRQLLGVYAVRDPKLSPAYVACLDMDEKLFGDYLAPVKFTWCARNSTDDLVMADHLSKDARARHGRR